MYYIQQAKPTSYANKPMAEQTGQQATGIKGAHSDQRDSFIHLERSNQQHTHKERTHQERRYDARLPGHIASWTGHTIARRASCNCTQHQSQPPQLHRRPPANQPCSQWFIARGRSEASSLHGNAALLRSQHHSTADDKITASKPRPHTSNCTTSDINIYIYIYIYVYMCVCVWVCVVL